MILRILFLASLMLSSQAYASIATVSAINGQATILRADQKLPVHLGDKIEAKDKIQTSKATKVQLIFQDRTIVTIGKDTLFSIPEYVYGDAKTSKVQFNLSKGVFKSMTGKIGKIAKQRFKIKTATATIGIRGTIYIVRVQGPKTQLSTLSGATYMQLNSNGKVYDVPAGKSLDYNVNTGSVKVQNLTIKTVRIQKDQPQSERDQLKDAIEAQTDDTGGSSGGQNDSNPLAFSTKAKGQLQSEKSKTQDSPDTVFLEQLASQNTGFQSGTSNSAENNLPTSTDTQLNQTTIAIPYKVVVGQDSYNEYGYWADKNSAQLTTPFTNPLAGVSQTPESTISGFMNSSSASAAYSGKLVAIDGSNKASGSLLMQVNFVSKTVSGAMNDLTLNGNKWDNNFTGSVSTSGVSVTKFTPQTSPAVSNISGNLNGKFYGNNAQGVAGTFNLSGTTTDGKTANITGSYTAEGGGP